MLHRKEPGFRIKVMQGYANGSLANNRNVYNES
jgi:hypothetical protein